MCNSLMHLPNGLLMSRVIRAGDEREIFDHRKLLMIDIKNESVCDSIECNDLDFYIIIRKQADANWVLQYPELKDNQICLSKCYKLSIYGVQYNTVSITVP